MNKAMEMERSAGVTCGPQHRGKAPPPSVLPPRPPVPPRNTLRDMDVHELGSPGHSRSNHALSCVAFSNKRNRAPLARHLSGPEETAAGDERARRRCGAGLREGEGSSAQQEPVDMRQQELGCARL